MYFCFSDCVKGYYKRAKAHAAVWNEKEAQRDFRMVAHLDITLSSLVHRELKALSERMKEKYWEEKEQYWNKLETMESKNKEEEEKTDSTEGKKHEGDHESVTTATKVGEESSQPKCAEVNKSEESKCAPSDGDKEETGCPDITLNTCDKMEGKDWQQMLRLVMLLQNEGNFHIKQKHFQEASVKFREALEYVDFLQNKVRVMGCKSKQRSCKVKVTVP